MFAGARCSLSLLWLAGLVAPLWLPAAEGLDFWRLAYVTRDEVAVVAQTSHNARIGLRLQSKDRLFESRLTLSTGDSPVLLRVGGLPIQTQFDVSIIDDNGQVLDRGKASTAPTPLTAERIHITFAGDLPTLADDSSLGLFAASIQVSDPDLIFWLGAGLKPDGFSWTSRSAYEEATLHFGQTEALRVLGKSYPQLSLFSARDYGPSGSSRHWSGRVPALEVYRAYWPSPLTPFPDTPGIFQIRYGDVEFFALDPYSQRDGFEVPSARAQIFSEAQLDWLLNALATSDASFKLILAPMSLLHPRDDEASLSFYKRSKEDLLEALRDPLTEGIILVTASDGPGELTRSIRAGGYPLFELGTGYLLHLEETPDLYPEDNYFRVPGTLVREPHYTSITVSGPLNARSLILTFHRLDGTEIRSERISTSDLRE